MLFSLGEIRSSTWLKWSACLQAHMWYHLAFWMFRSVGLTGSIALPSPEDILDARAGRSKPAASSTDTDSGSPSLAFRAMQR